jgi:hypothetical protein
MSDDLPAIAIIRIQRYDTPDKHTYAMVRADEVAAQLAASDRVETVQEWDPQLPPDITAPLAAQLAAPLHPVRVIIGDVTGDTWATGPLKGQPRPLFWISHHPPEMPAAGWHCQYHGGGRRCDMYSDGGRFCPAHTPGTRFETWEPLPGEDDEDED